MNKKDNERIYHIERKIDEILDILKNQKFPQPEKEPWKYFLPGADFRTFSEHPVVTVTDDNVACLEQ